MLAFIRRFDYLFVMRSSALPSIVVSFLFYIGQVPGQVSIPLGIEQGIEKKDGLAPYFVERRPRIGLALSGGGARGFAQIGVLKVLDKHGISVDCIAGTSMGSFVGGLYASGYTAAQIDSLAHTVQWEDIVQDAPPRRQLFLGQKEKKSRSILQVRFHRLSFDFRPAYTAGQKLTLLLNSLLLNAPCPVSRGFDGLPIPLRIVCTDLLSGNKVVLKRGALADAIRASMAVPLLFTPVSYGDSLLIDGGLVENMPVTEAKNMGADLVIAVDTSSKIRERDALQAPWEIADQVTTIMQQDQVRFQLGLADVSIQPRLDGISNTDFGRIDDMVRTGEEAAEEALSKIEALISRSASAPDEPSFWVESVSIEGTVAVLPVDVLPHFESKRSMNLGEIRWMAQSIYQSGFFMNVSAQFDTLAKALTFFVEEYPRVESIRFMGNTVFTDSLLAALLETKPGQPLNYQMGRRDVKNIIALYQRSGYALAHIEHVRFSDGSLEIGIDEGRIDGIQLIGNRRTKPFVILREIPLKPGDLFHVALLRQGLENVYSTGYFEAVRFEVDFDQGRQSLRFRLAEKGFTLLRAGTHYDTERLGQGFLELAEENVLGMGGEASFTGLIGKRDRFVQTTLRADRIFKTFVTARFNLSYQVREYPYYENNRVAYFYRLRTLEQSVLMGQQMKRFGTISFQLKNEHIRLDPFDRGISLGEQSDIRSFTLRSEVDTRDRMPYPSSGKHHILEYETALHFLGSEVSYFKIVSSMESFYPLGRGLVFHPRINWGTADPTVPFAKQFHLGGMDSFLGLHEDALVGKQFLLGSTELRLRLPGPDWLETHVSVRYDLGGIWGQYTNIDLEDFRNGIGALLLVNTPIGPMQAAWGRTNKGRTAAYFSMGYRF